MRGQRLFVTGGSGFFGAWLLESFAYANRAASLSAQATVLTRDPNAFRNKFPHLAADSSIALIVGDVRDFDFPAGNFHAVIHAAAESYARTTPSSPADELATILQGTSRTLEFAATHGVRKFLYVSSGAVYGRQPAAIAHLEEDFAGAPAPYAANAAYAEGKRGAEALCAAFAEQYPMACKIARCFAFVGPHLPLDAHFAIGNFIRDAMRGECIRVNGDGTPKRSYMYAADLAAWLWHILFRGPSLDPIHVGSGDAIAMAELARLVAQTIAPACPVQIARHADPNAPPEQYVPSVRKAERLLGLKCEIPLMEAIRRTAAWHGHKIPQYPPPSVAPPSTP